SLGGEDPERPVRRVYGQPAVLERIGGKRCRHVPTLIGMHHEDLNNKPSLDPREAARLLPTELDRGGRSLLARRVLELPRPARSELHPEVAARFRPALPARSAPPGSSVSG